MPLSQSIALKEAAAEARYYCSGMLKVSGPAM